MLTVRNKPSEGEPTVRIARLFVPIAVAGLVLAGCAAKKDAANTPSPTPADNGVKALSADEILNKATAALLEAGSFHVKGDISEEGAKFTVDLKIKGTDAAGTVTTPDGTIKILRIGADSYFQADAAFWKKFGGPQGDTISVLFKDKWVKASASGADAVGLGAFAGLADAKEFLKPEGTLTKGEEKTINGQATIALTDSKAQSTIYVATTGKPYPIRLEGPSGAGAMDITEFGATFEEIKAPAASEVVDLSAFIGK
jgi:hypothetical protein